MRKKINTHPLLVALFLSLKLTLVPQIRAALIAYEGFNYPDGIDIATQNGGTGWAGAWSSSGTSPAQAGSLTYSDGVNSLATSGNKWLSTGTAGSSQPTRDMTVTRGADNTTTWISFLGQRIGDKSGTAGPGGAATYERGANIALFESVSGNEQLDIGESSGVTNDAWMLRAPAQGGTVSNSISTSPIDVTSLLVIRIDHLPGATDVAYLWVNPALGTEPNIANASTKILGNKDYTFNRVRPFAGDANGSQAFAQWYVDEFRVGDTYADVTPTGSSTGHYSDATNETGLATTFDHLDFTGMAVSNDTTDIFFTLSVRAASITSPNNWGKYMIGIDSIPGGDTASNGWARPISMSSGMDYWLAGWVDATTSNEQIWKYSGAWALQTTTTSTISGNSVTFQTSLASLGLNPGDTFKFDAYSSGGGNTDSTVDALANPNQSISDWGVAYDSGASVYSYTVTGTSTAPTLGIQQSGGNVVLSWSDATFNLQSSLQVTGGYTSVAGATSPYTTSSSGAPQYFRLKK